MDTEKIVLKPCPFCGREAELRLPYGIIECTNGACGCKTPRKLDAEKALKIWNRRRKIK